MISFQLSVEERSRRLSDPPPAGNSSSINNIIDSLLQLLQSLNHASVVQFFTHPVLNCITGVLFPPNIAYSECGNAKVKQALLDLLRGIIIQSMMYPLPPKSLPVFDIILDSCPCVPMTDSDTNHSISTSGYSDVMNVSKRSITEKSQFTTDITNSVMDYISKADILNAEAAALPFTPGGSHHNVLSHLVYFCTRAVDLLWQDCLRKPASEMIEFLCRLTQQAEMFNIQEMGFYTCLNRAIVYDLSKAPNSELVDQMYILECFRK